MNDSEQNSDRLELKGDCTIYEISALYEQISEQLRKEPVLTLDLSSVERVDASFLQLLVAAQLEANRNESKLEITGASEAVNELATCIYCPVSLTDIDDVTASGE